MTTSGPSGIGSAGGSKGTGNLVVISPIGDKFYTSFFAPNPMLITLAQIIEDSAPVEAKNIVASLEGRVFDRFPRPENDGTIRAPFRGSGVLLSQDISNRLKNVADVTQGVRCDTAQEALIKELGVATDYFTDYFRQYMPGLNPN